MSRGALLLVVLAAYVVQVGIAPFAGLHRLDVFLTAALLVGLLMPVHEARLAGWIVGLVQDLASSDPLGIHAFTLGLTVLLLTWLRDLLNTRVWWARWLACLAAAVPGQVLYLLHLYYYAGRGGQPLTALLGEAAALAGVSAALATALTALPGLVLRRRRRRPLGV